MRDRREAVEELIKQHFNIEPSLTTVYRFISKNEDSPEEPIKLLEVVEDTFETNRVDFFVFPPSKNIPYSTMTATVSGKEMQKVISGKIGLPKSLDITQAEVYARGK
jgi:hypothetical protein